MKKALPFLILALVLVGVFGAISRGSVKPSKGKTITQFYWVEPEGKPKYIDRVITRVIFDDGNAYEKTVFANVTGHQFTANGLWLETTDKLNTVREAGEFGNNDPATAKADCIRQGFKSDKIAGYEVFAQEKATTELGSQVWLAPELNMMPLRVIFKLEDSTQGIDTIAIADGIDPSFVAKRDHHAKKPKG